MNYEMKRPLMEQIDKSLLEHAAELGKMEGGPGIVDVYQMQEMAEVHYYLKVEHDFKPDEVAALLQFADPLAAAVECWEERVEKNEFPICDVLAEIKAYDRFPLVSPAGDTRQQEQLIAAAKAMLSQNMEDFHASLMSMEKPQIIAQSAKTTAMQEAYDYMMDGFVFEPGDAEILLRMDNPLEFIANQWPSEMAELLDLGSQIGEAIEEAGKYAALQQKEDPSIPAAKRTDMQTEKPSVREQLRDNARKASQRPVPENLIKGGDAR